MTSMATEQPGWLRRLWGYLMRHRADVWVALGAAGGGAVTQTAVPLVVRQIVDGVIIARTSALWPWLALIVVLTSGTFAFAYLRRYHGGRVALEVQFDLRNDMHDHLQVLDATSLAAMPTGQLVSRANSDTALVQGLLAFFPMMGSNVLLMLLSLGVMLYLSPLLALVSVVVAPSLLVVSYRMRWRIFPATWDAQQREGDVIQIVDEDINGVRVVKAFGQERRELERVARQSEVLYGSQLRAVRLQARYQPLLEAIPTLAQVAILALGGWLVLEHRITLGTFLAFSTYVAQLMAPARQLAGVLTIGQQARAGIERIFQLLDLTPSIVDEDDARELTAVRGEVTFTDVHFSYGSGAPILTGVDLRIAPGERVALVGPSGSGKSTMAMLLDRFYDPTSGVVAIDGHDLRELSLASVRGSIGMVFEESFLFSDTVRSNIAFGRPAASDAEVEAAARAAAAHEFIEALPRGYDTVVGERGLSLSGGQRQRIALARAILCDPALLVLDDATSAVDARVEEEIHAALRTVLAGRTTLLIAHRRSTLHLADRIVVLEHGAIVEEGSHDELLARSPLYRTLLSGLEEEDAEQIGDRIEVLATMAPTASAWASVGTNPGAARTQGVSAPSMGAGLGGGMGGRGSFGLNLAPTPELLGRVAALRPVRDEIHVETDDPPKTTFSLGRLLGEFRRPLLLGLVLVVLDALATLAGPILVQTGINRGVSAGSATVLFAASGVFLLITLLDLLDQIGETFITGRTAQQIMLTLRVRIWAQLQRLSLDYYEREMAGRIMTRMTTDVDQFESLIENGLLAALVSMVTFVGVGVVLILINATLGIATLSVVVPLAIATVMFRSRAARLYEVSRERIAIVNADFQESLSGVRESQAFVHTAATIERFHTLGRQYLESRIAAQRLVSIYFPFVLFLSGIADVIVLGVGARLIAEGHLSTGALIAFILYVDMFFSPIQQLSQVFDAWQQTQVSVRRIGDLMTLESLTPESPAPVAAGALVGALDLIDVHFRYPTAPPRPGAGAALVGPADPMLLIDDEALRRPTPEALQGITLHVAPGETVALVGETGAGKSTVMKLLARFYDPQSGSVAVDGHDLRTLGLHDFRRQLGYVPQEAFLFSGSVRDNLAYGRPEATDLEVEAAARAVGAHDVIASLPGGYHHQLAERGRSLSSGERQLLALARAQLVDPAILLLDEATSNLDLRTEAMVTAAMQRVASGRTTIVIAHRLQTARAADRIVVLHAGAIAEVGTHDQLLVRGGRYAAMWEVFDHLASRPSVGLTESVMPGLAPGPTPSSPR